MGGSSRTVNNLFAVSANSRETEVNEFQALDTAMLCSSADIVNLDRKRETNEDEMNGMEEASGLYNLGNGGSGVTLNFKRAQPQHFGFLLGYGLGSVAMSAAGAGYQAVITPIDGDLDRSRSNPTFTGGFRAGKTIFKGRYASMAVDSVSAKFPREGFPSLSGTIKGTGKHETNIVQESVTAKDDDTSLTLAANGVEGASAAERLQNVQRIRAELASGEWTDVEFSAVSDAEPAVITITPPGSSTVDVTYKILYVVKESGWMTFPSQIYETPMICSDISLWIGGKYTVAGGFVGGRQLGCEINDIEYNLQNNMKAEPCFGGSSNHADKITREGRVQTLKINREAVDYIFQQMLDDDEMLAARILYEGAEFDTGHKYTVALYFPKIGLLSAPWSENGKKLAEAGDFRVFQHATEGSIRAVVKNQVASYAA